MKIVFVAVGVESLAIEFLSSFLKKQGHEVEIVFDPTVFATEAIHSAKLAKKLDIKKELIQQIIEKKPDFVGFSVFTLNYQRILKIAHLLKRKSSNIPIIFGGIHPTSVPEIVIKEKCVDMICVGEGEEALSELLNKPNSTNIKNIWFKQKNKIIKNPCRPLIDDLDTLPFPDKDLFYKIYPGFFEDYYTISSRGCPFACTYCGNNVIQNVYKGLGKKIRRRSPKNIVDELVLANKKYHPKKVTFVDDVFVQDLDWLKEFAKLYKKKVNLPYAMLTHPSFLSLEIAKLLKKSGCYFLLFGIQSASEKTRREILNRFESNAQISKAAQNCHQAGLKFSIDHIFNIPTEGLPEYKEAVNFYYQLNPTIINAYWLQYFPKTEIVNIAVKHKLLKKSDVPKIERGLTNTSLIVGIGGKDSFDPALTYSNIQLYFMLMPFLPSKLNRLIINNEWYLVKFKPPLILNMFLKFLIALVNKRVGVYFGIVKSIFFFTKYSLFMKLKYSKHN
ncbi:MAG: radical SAM protein [Candidatus Shapirobacteria bacterium]|nr:radical SAM protein [Candidatus Shapirobacteria bacterium]MDD3003104.1 radical SAM protein [Candidatus Shapirobacteria bacterium]MDD4383196.1 radical SAM protein [Candidatus Shapirobacteria bacterium]